MPRRIKYKPLKSFKPFHAAKQIRRCVIGGLGCGKTRSLVMDVLMLCNQNRGLPGGILCPTLKMFKRDVLPTLKEIAGINGIPYKYNQKDSELLLPDTNSLIYIFHGEDKGQSIRGPNLAFMAINEVTLLDLETYQAAIGRVRHPRAKRLSMPMSGTFEGNNALYDDIVEDDLCHLSYASSRDNHYLPKEYIKSIEASYDEDMIKQYIDGIPVINMSKKALRSFDFNKHVKPVKFNKEMAVWVSLDFNIEPMAAVLWNKYPDADNKVILKAFGEIHLKNSNTNEMAEVLIQKFPDKNIVIFPDPAGNSRSTKSHGKSDIAILRQAGFEDIRFKNRTASVRDCLNAANNLLSKGKIEIDSSCKQFIKDAQQVETKPGTDIIDKSDLRRTHWLDGFKYMVEFEYPIRARRGSWKEIKVR